MSSNSRPPVTIVLAVYNGLQYLPACLGSLTEQVSSEDEIIAVDDNSNDGSREYLEHHFPQIQLLSNVTNIGFAATCNRGATIAKNDLLVFLNQDTSVNSGWLDALVAGLEGEQIGMTTSKVLLMSDHERIHLCGQDVHYTGLVYGRGYYKPREEEQTRKKVGAVSGASFAIRRELWEELGGFDEFLFMYYEETDLSWRAQLLGYDSLYLPTSVLHHDFQPSQPSPSRLYYTVRNRYVLILKNLRWPTLLLMIPALLLAEALEWFIAFQHGAEGVRAKVKAWSWLLGHWPELNRVRTKTQRNRKVSDFIILPQRESSVQTSMISEQNVRSVQVVLVNFLFNLNYQFVLGLTRVFQW